jgi:uncharacterized protein
VQLSRFVLIYRDVAENEHILYSVLTDRYAGVDTATLKTIAQWSSGVLPEGPGEVELANVLMESGFLVSAREEDDDALRKHLERASEGRPDTMYVTLMPTLACNLACNYCFQKESPAFNRMSSTVESGTVQWILERAASANCGRLCVHYFGGEPLTRKDFVLRTAQTFSETLALRGGSFNWEITTNGIHLDLPFVAELRQYGDGIIKITLDGDRETHDQARVYRDGRGSFDQIFANLLEVAGNVRLRIGGNFYAGQEASYERLMARLDRAGLLSKLEAIHFKPVVDATQSENVGCTGCVAGTKETTDTLIQINRAVQKRASSMPSLLEVKLPNGPCELHWKNSYTIDPDGGVFKCPAVAGRPDLAIANVCSKSPDKPAPLLINRPWEQCGDCAFMPVCMGGCLGGQYLITGRLDQVFCKKPEFEANFREQVTGRYRRELADRSWDLVTAEA